MKDFVLKNTFAHTYINIVRDGDREIQENGFYVHLYIIRELNNKQTLVWLCVAFVCAPIDLYSLIAKRLGYVHGWMADQSLRVSASRNHNEQTNNKKEKKDINTSIHNIQFMSNFPRQWKYQIKDIALCVHRAQQSTSLYSAISQRVTAFNQTATNLFLRRGFWSNTFAAANLSCLSRIVKRNIGTGPKTFRWYDNIQAIRSKQKYCGQKSFGLSIPSSMFFNIINIYF